MATVNKVTSLIKSGGGTLDDSTVQAHIDAQNAEGWYIVAVDNLVGWYRFFWAKVVE